MDRPRSLQHLKELFNGLTIHLSREGTTLVLENENKADFVKGIESKLIIVVSSE